MKDVLVAKKFQKWNSAFTNQSRFENGRLCNHELYFIAFLRHYFITSFFAK